MWTKVSALFWVITLLLMNSNTFAQTWVHLHRGSNLATYLANSTLPQRTLAGGKQRAISGNANTGQSSGAGRSSQPPSVRKLSNGEYALTLTPAQQAAMDQFLALNSNLKLAEFKDSSGGDQLIQYMSSGEVQYPFACWGDLNRDGFMDVALVFISKRPINSNNWHEWWIVVFHGNSSGKYTTVLVTIDRSGCFDAMLYHRDENRIEFSCFDVAAGSFRWNGNRYVVQPKSGD